MLRSVTLGLAVICLLLFPSISLPQSGQKALSNQDIVEMLKVGLPQSTIILAIQKGPTQFDTSAQALIQLKGEGVSPQIMDAMIHASSPASPASPPPADFERNQPNLNNPFGVPQPGGANSIGGANVVLVDGENRVDMKYSTPDLRTNSMLGAVVNPFHKSKIRSALKGNHAMLRITNTSPDFEISIAKDVNATDLIAVVKFQLKSETREIETSRGSITGVSSGFRKQDILAVSMETVGNSAIPNYVVYRIKLVNPLPPGEYALVYQEGRFYDFGVDATK